MSFKSFYSIMMFGLIIVASRSGLYGIESLKSVDNQADYLMILPQDFLPELDPLIKHRELQGYRTEPIFMSMIQREFQDAGEEADQIRAFVTYALENWQTPLPAYLLLVGDSDIIPPYLELHHETDTAVDAWYGISDSDEDGFSDIAIGRFPVSNHDELTVLVEKTMRFECQNLYNYKVDYFFISDYWKTSWDEVFQRRTEQFVNEIIPSESSYLRLDLNPESEFAGDSLDFQEMIAQSPEYVVYFGHANQHVWSHSSLLLTENVVDKVHNRFPFILTTYGCSQTFLGDGPLSIVEQMLLLPAGGAVATFAPADINFETPGYEMVKLFHQTTLSDPHLTIGEVIQISKKQMPLYQTNTRFYTLLGDPALKFPSSDIEESEILCPISFQVMPNYPNPFNASTTLEFILPQSGNLHIQIYNVLGQIVLDSHEFYPNAGFNQYHWQANDLSSGVYIAKMSFENKVKVPRMHLLK